MLSSGSYAVDDLGASGGSKSIVAGKSAPGKKLRVVCLMAILVGLSEEKGKKSTWGFLRIRQLQRLPPVNGLSGSRERGLT